MLEKSSFIDAFLMYHCSISFEENKLIQTVSGWPWRQVTESQIVFVRCCFAPYHQEQKEKKKFFLLLLCTYFYLTCESFFPCDTTLRHHYIDPKKISTKSYFVLDYSDLNSSTNYHFTIFCISVGRVFPRWHIHSFFFSYINRTFFHWIKSSCCQVYTLDRTRRCWTYSLRNRWNNRNQIQLFVQIIAVFTDRRSLKECVRNAIVTMSVVQWIPAALIHVTVCSHRTLRWKILYAMRTFSFRLLRFFHHSCDINISNTSLQHIYCRCSTDERWSRWSCWPHGRRQWTSSNCINSE